MKELSIEEKAKAYDKALEKARQLCAYPTTKPFISDLQDLFPELKESEDEKIRKELIEFVKSRGGFKQEYIAWLEKQGKEDSSIQQAYEWGYTEGKRIERKHWVEKQKFSEDYNSIDPQFGKPIEQNPAWSEEDECYMGECIGAIATKDGWSFEEKRKTKHWLKSLKDRYTWKPSIAQLNALSIVSKGNAPDDIEAIVSLYNDLKKLTE